MCDTAMPFLVIRLGKFSKYYNKYDAISLGVVVVIILSLINIDGTSSH